MYGPRTETENIMSRVISDEAVDAARVRLRARMRERLDVGLPLFTNDGGMQEAEKERQHNFQQPTDRAIWKLISNGVLYVVALPIGIFLNLLVAVAFLGALILGRIELNSLGDALHTGQGMLPPTLGLVACAIVGWIAFKLGAAIGIGDL